ncbi:uncharacterized protein [Dermacentor andersoni]|uniref:uncharacterized protein n=1 Tax=Dermacentor andersoni TaxID=34620 RepID=UPI003B3A9671
MTSTRSPTSPPNSLEDQICDESTYTDLTREKDSDEDCSDFSDGTIKYCLDQLYPARTDEETLVDMKAACRTGTTVHGVKGPSPLINLSGFSPAWSWCPDYMHCVLLGVARQLTELWLSDKGADYYCGVFILLKDSISRADVNLSTQLLTEFAVGVEFLYGRSNMIYNVHQLLHLTKSVVLFGPLWAHSCFSFETNMGIAVRDMRKSLL